MMTRQWMAVVVLALAAARGWGADFGALKPQGYVSDFAGVVDAATKQQLEAYCASVERSTGAQFALVTLPSLEGEPIEDVANLLYRKWGVGNKKTNEGLLLLLSIRDRRSRVEVGYGLEPYLTDGYAGMMLREMRPALRARQYGQALVDGARVLAETVAQKKGVALQQAPAPRRQRHESDGFPWEVLLVVGGVLLAMLFLGGRSGPRYPGGGGGGGGFLAGMILGQLMGGGGPRTRSGGGFGGYDSGDSFGGFGGGDSGGGGASSDW